MRSGLSWLSLASLDLLDLLEKENGHSIAHSFVKTTAWMTKEVLVPSHIVISNKSLTYSANLQALRLYKTASGVKSGSNQTLENHAES